MTIHGKQNVITDFNKSCLCTVILTIGRLKWLIEMMTTEMDLELINNNAFNKLGDERKVGYRPIFEVSV